MTQHHIRIATHRSPLALKYTKKIAAEIENMHPQISVELVQVDTKGDQFYFKATPDLGGKCRFIEEVDRALLDGLADLAAHVIEEKPNGAADWPRGWLCAKSHLEGDNSLYFITELKRLPEYLFSPSLWSED